MNKVSKFRLDKSLLIPLLIFMVISVSTLYSAQSFLPSYMNLIVFKQFLFYLIGFGIIYFILFMSNDFIYKNIFLLYIIGNLLLVLVLFFGIKINGATSWFKFPFIGTFQPSEFMKIILIIFVAKLIDSFMKNNLNPSFFDEFKLLLKILFFTLIPALLTFIQPDTGLVIIYLIAIFFVIFNSNLKRQWLFILGGLLIIFLIIFFYLFYFQHDLFINIFGTNFFYRIDRILDWNNKNGMQLTNSLTNIGSAGFLGHGFKNNLVYFPEAHTDFIFTIYASNYGLIGSLFLILLFIYLDLKIISIAVKNSYMINKLILSGILGMLLYQQFQNIGMTLGLIPITGITLPFISYGGSSILSYMIVMGILFNISNDNDRYTN